MVLVVIALFVLVCYLGQNHYRRVTAIKEKGNKTRYEPKPYLQAKIELDAEEKKRGEMEAKERRHELVQEDRYEVEGDECRAELVALNSETRLLPSSMERHELRSEDHSKELDGHEIGKT